MYKGYNIYIILFLNSQYYYLFVIQYTLIFFKNRLILFLMLISHVIHNTMR